MGKNWWAGVVMATLTMNEGVDRLAGRYRFVGGQRERKAWEEAIEDVVVEMNLIVRGMARKRIRKTNRIADEVAIEHRDNQLSIRLDDHTYIEEEGRMRVRVRVFSARLPRDLRYELTYEK